MNNYDGSIVIGTDIDTKEFDSQIDYIEERLKEIEYLFYSNKTIP